VRIVLVDPRGDSRPYDHGLGAALAARGHEVVLATCRFRHGALPPAPDVAVQERFYRLDKLCPPTAVAGEPRSADDADKHCSPVPPALIPILPVGVSGGPNRFVALQTRPEGSTQRCEGAGEPHQVHVVADSNRVPGALLEQL